MRGLASFAQVRPRLALRLVRCQRGLAAVEMALIAPLLIVLVLGVADSTMGFNRKMELNHAAQSGIEEYTAAGTNWAALSSSNVQTLVAGYAGVAASDVTITKWLECNNVKAATGVSACTSTQTTSQYVKITVNATYDPAFGFIASAIVMTGSAFVRVK